MGEIAEMMIDGTLCESCGVYMGDAEGFSRRCHSCRREDNIASGRVKLACPTCRRKVKPAGLADHQRDVHGVKP